MFWLSHLVMVLIPIKGKRKGPTSLYLALLAVLVLMWQGVCRLHSPDLSLGHLLSLVAL